MIDSLQSLIDGDGTDDSLASAGLSESSFVQLKIEEKQKADQAVREKT